MQKTKKREMLENFFVFEIFENHDISNFEILKSSKNFKVLKSGYLRRIRDFKISSFKKMNFEIFISEFRNFWTENFFENLEIPNIISYFSNQSIVILFYVISLKLDQIQEPRECQDRFVEFKYK
jgi:hypothetical protein